MSGANMIENDAVRAALVADLARSAIPTTIMGITLVSVAAFAHASTGIGALLVAGACGGAATIAKLAVMWFQRQRTNVPSLTETRQWGQAHAATTFAVASSVSVVGTICFAQPNSDLQLLATSLIFGYGSGVVGRLGIRPKIAIPALLIAAVPPIVTVALQGNVSHHIVATIFFAFLLGSFESIRHIHRTAIIHVGMRLEMAMLARNDALTGLANRIGLREAFKAISPDEALAVLCLDLDGFKQVNDQHGHAAGDMLLRSVANRLQACVSENATVARAGGDEFIILQPGLRRRDDVAALAKQIDECLREPFDLGSRQVTIGASVGHASSPVKPTDFADLLARADEVSYQVKAERQVEAAAKRSGTVLRLVT